MEKIQQLITEYIIKIKINIRLLLWRFLCDLSPLCEPISKAELSKFVVNPFKLAKA